jgi:AraC family transcriptional regulator of adaptative response/methylated-DNA-[protein]-cysteine methyltransferase
MTNLQTEILQSSNLPRGIATYNGMSSMKNAATPSDIDSVRWRAVLQRDSSSDGAFVFGVVSTGVYCRPSCPARRPLRKNVRFFPSPQDAEKAGLRACFRCKPADVSGGRSALARRLCRYIEANTGEKITLNTLSKLAGISRFHLQRVFTAEVGVSPAKYLQSCRFSQFKKALHKHPVTTAWAEAGYSSSSRVYESARKRLGMAPSRYRSGAPQEELRFSRFNTPLGDMVLVAGASGVCSVQFAENKDTHKMLQAEYPNAALKQDDRGLADWAAQVRALVAGDKSSHRIPLDIRGTAFQQKVWQQLQKIPSGQTRTYSEIAHAVGRSSAVRAVANACASNALAVVVPCHRVIHKDGSANGYRWGAQRKQNLLKMESR